jgi:hypothetical protein
MSPVTEYYLSQADIAGHLGVSSEAVRTWRKRYADFPAPDAWTGIDEMPGNAAVEPDARRNPRENSRSVPGWLRTRLPEIETWRAGMPGPGARTDLA